MKYFLIFLSSIIWISGCSLNQPPQKTFIETMMKSDKCKNSCWLGIEAGMTIEHEKVYDILSDYYGREKVHYTESGSGVIWRINPSIAFSEGGFVKVDENNQIVSISITPRSNQITVDDLVAAFGTPEITIVKNPNDTEHPTTPCGLLRLEYPTIGLSVFIESGTEIKYVLLMEISKPFPVSEVKLREPIDLVVNWEEHDKYCSHTTPARP